MERRTGGWQRVVDVELLKATHLSKCLFSCFSTNTGILSMAKYESRRFAAMTSCVCGHIKMLIYFPVASREYRQH